jgi:ATP-dependent Lhr-like helicase
MPVGRWSLWRQQLGHGEKNAEAKGEHLARQLLLRYGVVFRELLARENSLPPWRNLLAIYRRLEARGEIRGGRFVNGFVGEQFALPEAVDKLRAGRREMTESRAIILAAADPLNMAGILSADARVSPYTNQSIAYQNGAVIGVGLIGELMSRLQHLTAPHPLDAAYSDKT